MNSEESEVSSRNEEMEHQNNSDNAEFINNLKTEVLKQPEIHYEIWKLEGDLFMMQLLKRTFDEHRSILTKLFSLSNNPNGVDVLIEYCDYYISAFINSKQKKIIPVEARLRGVIYGAFVAMSQNGITEEVRRSVWNLLVTTFRTSPISSPSIPNLPSNDHRNAWPLKKYMFLTNEFDGINLRPLAMVIMADSNLGAAIKAFIESNNTLYQVDRVLVPNSIKEQLLNTIGNDQDSKDRILSNLFVFSNTEEALVNLNGEDKVRTISLWSENIIAAKKFSANAQTDTIWINALGLFDFGLHSIHNITLDLNFKSHDSVFTNLKHIEDSLTRQNVAKKYDHFYGGKWQSPVNGKYWTHNRTGDFIAETTKQDITNCVLAARKAFKDWRSTKLSERVQVIRYFAERLRANGQSEYANTVLEFLHRPSDLGTSLSVVRDGEARILTTPEPVGVIAIGSNNLAMLFSQLIIASVTGNAVVVLPSHVSYMSFAPYCDLLGTCGFPPGLISCMYTTGQFGKIIEPISGHFDRILPESMINLNRLFLNPYKHMTIENTLYNNTFISVTKPKCVWIPIQ